MFNRLLKNRKGTAEVIGSVMFIVILLFFFTNVYLWHDAATREMNDMYVQKINSPITVSVPDVSNPYDLIVTNNGGLDAKLSTLWINVASTSGTDRFHGYYNLTVSGDLEVPAGSSIPVHWNHANTYNSEGASYVPHIGDNVRLQLVTTVGNLAACTYTLTPS